MKGRRTKIANKIMFSHLAPGRELYSSFVVSFLLTLTSRRKWNLIRFEIPFIFTFLHVQKKGLILYLLKNPVLGLCLSVCYINCILFKIIFLKTISLWCHIYRYIFVDDLDTIPWLIKSIVVCSKKKPNQHAGWFTAFF